MNEANADFFGIQSLYSRYCFGIDGNDAALFVDCFAADGIFQVAEREFRGAEQLAMIANAGGDRPRHHYANLWVKRIHGGEAHATAYFFLFDLKDGACAGFGHYDDDLVRGSDGIWRFQHRRITFQFQSESYKARTNAIKKR